MEIINYKSKDDFRAIMPFILFNKPYNVQCQFSGPSPNLSDHIHTKDVYAAGRLDKRSEGLLILTDDGRLQQGVVVTHPLFSGCARVRAFALPS